MSEKVLKAVLGLVLIGILWQLVAIGRSLANQRADIVSLRREIDGLRQTAQANMGNGRMPLPVRRPARTLKARTAPQRPEQETLLEQTAAPDSNESADASDQTRWEEQQQAMDQLRSQLLILLGEVETIGENVDAIGAAVLELQNGAQIIESDVSAVGREVARLSTAVERMAGERRY
jgi:hypothetical protein